MQKVFNVAVDIGRKLPAPAFEVNTNDLKSVKLIITINNGQILLNLTDTTVRIAIRKPDNHIIFQDCTVKDATNGQVEIILENQAYITPGTHTAEIMCYKGSEVVAVSGTFSYKSTKGIMNNEAVESKSEFTAINQKIEEAKKLLEDAAESGAGVDGQARQDIQEVTAQLAETSQSASLQTANFETMNFIPDIDISNAYSVNAKAPLNIETYVPNNNEVVHPSVLHFPNKWNNYHYWMVYTPYPNANQYEENPSLAVSNDGLNWITPPGLTNPVESTPINNKNPYNADGVLVMDKNGKTMHMVWKYADDTSRVLYVRSSDDGINWNQKRVVVSTNANERVDASPKILFDGQKYVMWTVDSVPNPNKLILRTCDEIDGTWSEAIVCNLPFPTKREIWHFDLCKIGSLYIMIVMEGLEGDYGSFAYLKLAKSYDGVNWRLADNPLFPQNKGRWDNYYYKACILPVLKNGQIALRMWYGTATHSEPGKRFLFGLTDITFDRREREEKYKTDLLKASMGLEDNIVFVDTFNRANGDVSLSSSGKPWSNLLGNGLTVVNNKASVKVATNSISGYESGLSNAEISMEIHTKNLTSMLIAKAVPGGGSPTFIRFGSNIGVYEVSKYDGTSMKVLTGSSGEIGTVTVGDRIKLKIVGDVYECYVNDILKFEFTDTHNNSSTFYGVQMSSQSALIDNFAIRKI